MFTIAEKLGCATVDELEERMSESEFHEWSEYFDIKEEERKKARRKQKQKSRAQSRTINSGR